jgi:hypothetical protein
VRQLRPRLHEPGYQDWARLGGDSTVRLLLRVLLYVLLARVQYLHDGVRWPFQPPRPPGSPCLVADV